MHTQAQQYIHDYCEHHAAATVGVAAAVLQVVEVRSTSHLHLSFYIGESYCGYLCVCVGCVAGCWASATDQTTRDVKLICARMSAIHDLLARSAFLHKANDYER